MLPGIRILFAITILAVSVLVFALGAAAWLRTAHENFASSPLRPIETPATARVDLTPTTLAVLRVEPEATPPPAAVTIEAPPAIAAPAEPAAAAPVVVAPTAPIAPVVSAPTPVATAVAVPVEPTPASPAPLQTDTPQPAPATVAEPQLAEVARQTPPPVIAETKAVDANPAAAPAVVAALTIDKLDAPASTTLEPAPVDVAAERTETPPLAATHPAGTDTLQTDDKMIDAPKVAALAEPSQADVQPLPKSEVKIPTPRVDPIEAEAKRKQLLAQQQARARAAKARRLAAARARAAAQARATTAASNPFGVPIGTSSTSTSSNN